MAISLVELNAWGEEDFVAAVGPVFEKSPWIASAVADRRPFSSREDLLAAMVAAVEASPTECLMDLLRAHPDLAARLHEVDTLTPESQGEQRAAGLLDLPTAEAEELRALLAAYRAKFAFPFIICARLNNAGTILAAIRQRMNSTTEQEINNAWQEVQKIAALRLRDLLARED
jgi:2-oxo-4-hydroxy-4-carboxy-5-ureidoimidazoline decarboxylase